MPWLDDSEPLQCGRRIPGRPALDDLAINYGAHRFAGKRMSRAQCAGSAASRLRQSAPDGPVQLDLAIDRRQSVHADMEIWKRGAVQRNAELDPLRTLHQIGDQAPVVDVVGGEQLIC